MDSPRPAYSWILRISGLSWAPMILWQPRQRSTEGRPAYSERRASAWQYWHWILNEFAWITWLKKIGWIGAPAGWTSGSAWRGSWAGSASVRTNAMTWRICVELSVRLNGGMVGARPCAGPPSVTTPTRNSSGSELSRRPSVRLNGLVANPVADGPSPLPDSPWQVAQFVW